MGMRMGMGKGKEREGRLVSEPLAQRSEDYHLRGGRDNAAGPQEPAVPLSYSSAQRCGTHFTDGGKRLAPPELSQTEGS